jgi:transposase
MAAIRTLTTLIAKRDEIERKRHENRTYQFGRRPITYSRAMDTWGIAVKNDSHSDTHQDSRKSVERYQRVELITGTTRQLRRSEEERAQILAESFEPGANISAVARRHGVNSGLLHYWRKRARAQAREATATQAPRFVPVAIAKASETSGSESAPRPALPRQMIEIETVGGRVHVPEGVDARTLSVVLAALRRVS